MKFEPIMECDKEMDTSTPGDNNNNYRNNKFELANPKNILLMSTQLELFYNNTHMYQKSSNGNKLCILQEL
jgi:hypothetical protein